MRLVVKAVEGTCRLLKVRVDQILASSPEVRDTVAMHTRGLLPLPLPPWP